MCESPLRYDRVLKAHRYAHAGIADYWIVNLVDRQLEIYRDPQPDAGRPVVSLRRRDDRNRRDGHAIPLASPTARIAVSDLLP